MTQADGMAAMTKIINTLMQRPDSVPFREPVDWRGLGLYDYPQVIAKPMDLTTVKQTIERQGYKSVNDCADDIRLIWNNCKKYNQDGSDFYNLADGFSKRFEERFSKVKAENPALDEEGNPVVDEETGEKVMDEEILGRLEQRADDTEEALTKRLAAFGANRDAIATAFASIALTVDGNRPPDEVYADITKFLEA